MNYTIETPIGLLVPIQQLQNKLFDKLPALWNNQTIDGYGLCELINDENNKKDVMWFLSKNDSIQVSVAEKTKFFFIQREQSKKINNIDYQTTIELVFIVDLAKIKPNVAHRNQSKAEAQAEAEKIINLYGRFNITNLDPTGYESALRQIKYTQEDDKQPYHVFRFDLSIIYDPLEVCNCGCN